MIEKHELIAGTADELKEYIENKSNFERPDEGGAVDHAAFVAVL